MAREWVASFSHRVPIRRQHLSQPMHRSTTFLRVRVGSGVISFGERFPLTYLAQATDSLPDRSYCVFCFRASPADQYGHRYGPKSSCINDRSIICHMSHMTDERSSFGESGAIGEV